MARNLSRDEAVFENATQWLGDAAVGCGKEAAAAQGRSGSVSEGAWSGTALGSVVMAALSDGASTVGWAAESSAPVAEECRERAVRWRDDMEESDAATASGMKRAGSRRSEVSGGRKVQTGG